MYGSILKTKMNDAGDAQAVGHIVYTAQAILERAASQYPFGGLPHFPEAYPILLSGNAQSDTAAGNVVTVLASSTEVGGWHGRAGLPVSWLPPCPRRLHGALLWWDGSGGASSALCCPASLKPSLPARPPGLQLAALRAAHLLRLAQLLGGRQHQQDLRGG